MSRVPILALALVCVVARAVNAVAHSGVCSASSECVTTDANSMCSHMISTCEKGTCQCKSGYTYDSTCKMDVGHGEACDATKHCMYGTTCQNSLCACLSGTNTWHAAAKMCVTDTKKLISEVCTANTDCLAGTTMSECVANSGATTPKYCRCKADYMAYNTYMCMTPHLDQACTATCSKAMDFTSILTGAGQVTETCQSSMCKCPPGSAMLSVTYASTTYKICQTTATGTGNDIADGATCTASNKCHSHLCYICPATPASTTSKCVSDVAPNSAAGMSGLALALLAPFLLLLLK